MLGQPIAMLIPDVVGMCLTGNIREGVTATDVVLTITQMLRKHGVVGKFVEFFGSGLDDMAVATRATIANMAPEYGATCGFFPTDATTLDYLRLTGRDEARIELVEAYAKRAGHVARRRHAAPGVHQPAPGWTSRRSSRASPGRSARRTGCCSAQASSAFKTELSKSLGVPANDVAKRFEVNGKNFDIGHGDVVIAAITSCTNTSNPYVMVAAGLVARKARALGLRPKPWVKTSLAPGSQVVTEYLNKSGLHEDLDAMGFALVGYGCTTCIGNSGPLNAQIASSIEENNVVAVSVLSGNRNFEGRVHPQVRANYWPARRWWWPTRCWAP